jgi:peptide deformylase
MQKPTILTVTRFGNPILRKVARHVSATEITSDKIQTLVADMRYTLTEKKYGVGLAAPQVGKNVALSIIGIKATPNRPNLEPFESVIINPEITKYHGKLAPEWEGCISCGTGDEVLCAQVPRYKKITLRWHDETGKRHHKILDGFAAHVAQHEVDHLNGILFVDKVEDTKTYMTSDEYRKRIVKKQAKDA